jgi:internalin A
VKCLVFDWNRYPDINLDFMSGMKDLEIFEAKGAGIRDISVLGDLTKLWSVFLTDNLITDVSPLARLTNLRELALSNNPITDYSPLKDMYEQLEGKDFEMK